MHKQTLFCLLIFCLLVVLGESRTDPVTSPETEEAEINKVTINALGANGKVLRTGLGFLYDERTIVCSYADVRGATQIQVEWGGSSRNTNQLIAFSETMDLAIFAAPDEIPAVTPIVSSDTVAVEDNVSYWMEQKGNWELTSATVSEILDTGKGYDLILIASNHYSDKSTPLYNAAGKIVGWLQGKRAIPMETIASYAEKGDTKFTMADLNSSGGSWKYSKPLAATLTPISFGEIKTVNGPVPFSFKMDIPSDWEEKILERSERLHIRYQKASISVEVRATPLANEDLITALGESENLVFANFLRAELVPYSLNYLSGFRATYDDNDAINPYALDVFYTSFSEKLYVLSITYPKKLQNGLKPLIEQIFSSFRM